MMAHNLCYTTLVDKGTIERLALVKDQDYIQTPNNGLCSIELLGPRTLTAQQIFRSFRYLQKAEGVTSHHFGRLDFCP